MDEAILSLRKELLIKDPRRRGEAYLELKHAYLVEVVAATLSAEQRERLHSTLADGIAADDTSDTSLLLAQMLGARRLGEAQRLRVEVARRLMKRLGFSEAAEHYSEFLAHISEHPHDVARRVVAIRMEYAECLSLLGRRDEAELEVSRAIAAETNLIQARKLRSRATEWLRVELRD